MVKNMPGLNRFPSISHRMTKVTDFMRFIRISHTIFALPFALGAMFVAARGWPSWHIAAWILLAMVSARTAAMTFNRVVDWEIDRRNPRTSNRQKLATREAAILVTLGSAVVFILASFALNTLCGLLSPVALAIILFYSLTKRFTHYAQFFLGLALAVAPVGAWLAVTGSFALPPLLLATAVALWVAGFDAIYATQDYEFDVKERLHSIVVKLGPQSAIRLAIWLHVASFLFLVAFGLTAHLGVWYGAALAVIALTLIAEHLLAKKGDPRSINHAFFQANALVGAAFLLGCILSLLI